MNNARVLKVTMELMQPIIKDELNRELAGHKMQALVKCKNCDVEAKLHLKRGERFGSDYYVRKLCDKHQPVYDEIIKMFNEE